MNVDDLETPEDDNLGVETCVPVLAARRSTAARLLGLMLLWRRAAALLALSLCVLGVSHARPARAQRRRV